MRVAHVGLVRHPLRVRGTVKSLSARAGDVDLWGAVPCTVRLLQNEDVEDVHALDVDAHAPGLWTRDQYLSEIQSDSTLAFGLFANGANTPLVGFIFLSIVLDEAMITNLAVSRRYRRRGAAALLLDAAIDEGRQAGVTLFVLEVRSSNRAALRLYGARGFDGAGRRRGYYSNPRDDALVLVRKEPACDIEETSPSWREGSDGDSAEGRATSPAAASAEGCPLPSSRLREGWRIELQPPRLPGQAAAVSDQARTDTIGADGRLPMAGYFQRLLRRNHRE